MLTGQEEANQEEAGKDKSTSTLTISATATLAGLEVWRMMKAQK